MKKGLGERNKNKIIKNIIIILVILAVVFAVYFILVSKGILLSPSSCNDFESNEFVPGALDKCGGIANPDLLTEGKCG